MTFLILPWKIRQFECEGRLEQQTAKLQRDSPALNVGTFIYLFYIIDVKEDKINQNHPR